MENMRMKLSQEGHFHQQPLGRSKAVRGLVSENLGCTNFKRSSRDASKLRSWKPRTNSDSHCEDELDLLSPRLRSSSPLSPVRKKGKPPRESSPAIISEPTTGSDPKSKLRPNYRGAEPSGTQISPYTLSPCSSDVPTSSNNFHSPELLSLGSKKSQNIRKRVDGHGTSPLEELSPNREKRLKVPTKESEPKSLRLQDDRKATKSSSKKRSLRSKPAPFPMEPTSSNRTSSASSKPSSSRTYRNPVRKGVESSRRIPQQFPLDIPLNDSLLDTRDSDEDELALTDSDNNTILTYGGPRPFPMSMAGITTKSSSELSIVKQSSTRSDLQKNQRTSRESLGPGSFHDSTLLADGEESVDPSTICPYCDEPWPSTPSPTLEKLLKLTSLKSRPDPRPGNALGLKAPLTSFVDLCQRHRFETTHLPLARKRGWPARLDFVSLPKRIRKFKYQLQRFVKCPDESHFWREVLDDIKRVGKMKVVSVSGQYATFERTLPGYYGVQGSIIIHQTLYSLFPQDSINSASIHPLTLNQFLTSVLVPETGILLIQEDLRLPSKEEACLVLNESKQYGVVMFPEQSQGAEAAEVGEQLAMERARERRMILKARGEGAGGMKESGVGHDASTLDDSEESTPRPLRATEKTRRNKTSWRPRRSSSASPDPRPRCTSRPASCELNTKPHSLQPKLRASDEPESQWVFDLRNTTSSSDCEDVELEESNASRRDGVKLQELEIYSNATSRRGLAGEETLRDERGSYLSDGVAKDVTPKGRSGMRLRPTKERGGLRLDRDRAGVNFGQTKRKRGGVSGKAAGFDWLMDEISE